MRVYRAIRYRSLLSFRSYSRLANTDITLDTGLAGKPDGASPAYQSGHKLQCVLFEFADLR